ncbi:hypothetical protein, partial [Mesorhizobium sp. M0239]|uniref:hypothetical protein n=1 Tax=Mesorhizobium sp. M0239 TaxID=2956924 RepID=UPI00333C372F
TGWKRISILFDRSYQILIQPNLSELHYRFGGAFSCRHVAIRSLRSLPCLTNQRLMLPSISKLATRLSASGNARIPG